MIRLQLSLELAYDIAEPGCDFIFNIHAAATELVCALRYRRHQTAPRRRAERLARRLMWRSPSNTSWRAASPIRRPAC
jgi:hypothetical protein